MAKPPVLRYQLVLRGLGSLEHAIAAIDSFAEAQRLSTGLAGLATGILVTSVPLYATTADHRVLPSLVVGLAIGGAAYALHRVTVARARLARAALREALTIARDAVAEEH